MRAAGGVHQAAQVVDGGAGLHAAGDDLGGERTEAGVQLLPSLDASHQRAPVLSAAQRLVRGSRAIVLALAGAALGAGVAKVADEDPDDLVDELLRLVRADVS